MENGRELYFLMDIEDVVELIKYLDTEITIVQHIKFIKVRIKADEDFDVFNFNRWTKPY